VKGPAWPHDPSLHLLDDETVQATGLSGMAVLLREQPQTSLPVFDPIGRGRNKFFSRPQVFVQLGRYWVFLELGLCRKESERDGFLDVIHVFRSRVQGELDGILDILLEFNRFICLIDSRLDPRKPFKPRAQSQHLIGNP
jgi:hypothetical protein